MRLRPAPKYLRKMFQAVEEGQMEFAQLNSIAILSVPKANSYWFLCETRPLEFIVTSNSNWHTGNDWLPIYLPKFVSFSFYSAHETQHMHQNRKKSNVVASYKCLTNSWEWANVCYCARQVVLFCIFWFFIYHFRKFKSKEISAPLNAFEWPKQKTWWQTHTAYDAWRMWRNWKKNVFNEERNEKIKKR